MAHPITRDTFTRTIDRREKRRSVTYGTAAKKTRLVRKYMLFSSKYQEISVIRNLIVGKSGTKTTNQTEGGQEKIRSTNIGDLTDTF